MGSASYKETRHDGRQSIRHDRSDRLGGTTLASGDHDKKLHDAVIDLATATLNDINILVPDGGADIDAGLAIGKFTQIGFGGGSTQALTDGICKAWMRRARENLHAAHLERWLEVEEGEGGEKRKKR